jgi:hypothetical protein
MSNSRKRRHERADYGIRPDERGQDQPTDKTRAQQVTHGEEAGRKAQRDSAVQQSPSPGQPAGGE